MIESGGAVSVIVTVTFFVSVVLRDIVEVVTSDDNGSLHFGAEDNAFQDLASDVNVAGEGAFLIDIVALDGFFGSFEVESYVLVVPHSSSCLFGQQLLGVEEDSVLFLEGTFMLNSQIFTWMSAMATEY